MRINSFINGHNSPSLNFKSIKKNPFTSEELHQISHANLLEAVTAIQTAQKFYLEYKQSTFAQRLFFLEAIKNYLYQNEFELAKLEALDQGLPLDFVQSYSIKSAMKSLDSVILELSEAQTLHNENIKFDSVGVITIIASWNLSFRIVCERVFPALAAGNTVVVKVSSTSPITAFLFSELIQKCQLPAGLIQIIVSEDPEVKKILVSHPGVKAISFTGLLAHSSEILKLIAQNSLQQFKKIQISSGTKNTAVALNEPTEDQLRPILKSFLIGQGQLAWNSARLFIVEKNEKEWIEAIQDYLSKLKPSEGINDPSLWTPCLKDSSFKNFNELIYLAKSDQARLIQTKYMLNAQQQKSFLPISFTQDMSNCSTLQQDQVLAPLFILSTVKYPFDIPKYSNVSYFGSAAHLWGDPNRLGKIIDQLEVGLICTNSWSVERPGSFKSKKQSGYGLQDSCVFGDFFSNVKILT